MRTIIIDNYDSFTYNIAQMVAQVNGEPPRVFRNDDITWEELEQLQFDNLIISPGPGSADNPDDFGVCADVIRRATFPVLGVCLGLQGIAHVLGGKIVHAPVPMHGRVTDVMHDGQRLFADIASPFRVTRYHSLMAVDLPPELTVTARTADGIIMGIEHTTRPLYGVQFHPESICTESGYRLFENFARLTDPHFVAPPSYAPPLPGQAPLAQETPSSRYRLHWKRLDMLADTAAVFAELFGGKKYPFWLDSSLVKEGVSRFSFMGDGEGPHSHLLVHDAHGKVLRIIGEQETVKPGQALLAHVDAYLAQRALPAGELPFDFNCGYVGYVGYEMKSECGAAAAHKSPVPDAQLLFADRVVAFDHLEQCMYLVCVEARDNAQQALSWIARMATQLAAIVPKAEAGADPVTGERPEFQLRHGKAAYERKIDTVQLAIRDGETYEVCLTNKLNTSSRPDPARLHRELRRRNPVQYGAFLDYGSLQIVCSSPERFLRIDRCGVVESKPIKGTMKRGQTPAEDARLCLELAQSEKNQSENLMIVDLMRNDLGKLSETGSVHVPKLMDIETYATVHQMVSTVRSVLKRGCSAVDMFRAAFPGGSMTGAPKHRTMEIIDDLEQEARGVYSGAIGYFGLCGGCDFNIVIRTVVVTEQGASVGVGGAIIALSDTEDEYQEILLKGQAPMAAVSAALGHGAPLLATDGPVAPELMAFRTRIDALDQALIASLAERLQVCGEVAEFKKRNRIPMMQPDRVNQVKSSRASLGGQLGLDKTFVHALYGLIIDEACRVENDIIDADADAQETAT